LSVDHFSPDSGVPGSSVTLTGTGLDLAGAVIFPAGQQARIGAVSHDGTQLVVEVPDYDGGIGFPLTAPLFILAQHGPNVFTAHPFTLLAKPVLAQIAPTYGTAGTVVHLRGINLCSAGQQSLAYFNGVAVEAQQSCDATDIWTTVPTNAQSGPVWVERS